MNKNLPANLSLLELLLMFPELTARDDVYYDPAEETKIYNLKYPGLGLGTILRF